MYIYIHKISKILSNFWCKKLSPETFKFLYHEDRIPNSGSRNVLNNVDYVSKT